MLDSSSRGVGGPETPQTPLNTTPGASRLSDNRGGNSRQNLYGEKTWNTLIYTLVCSKERPHSIDASESVGEKPL